MTHPRSRLPDHHLPPHLAESFLRAAGLPGTRDPEFPELIPIEVTLAGHAVHAALQDRPDDSILILNVSLPFRPSQPRAFRETTRLCQMLSANLASGGFHCDELDGAVCFRCGHFVPSARNDADWFNRFIDHCFSATSAAIPAFSRVTSGEATAAEAIALVLPPSAS